MTTVFQCRNKVSSLTLNHCQNLILKQPSFWVDSKTHFCSYLMMVEKLKSLYNVQMATVFQCRNSVSSLTLNHCENLILKQRSFWVESETHFCSDITILEKSKLCISIKKITILQRRNNVNLITLNQRPNLTFKQR